MEENRSNKNLVVVLAVVAVFVAIALILFLANQNKSSQNEAKPVETSNTTQTTQESQPSTSTDEEAAGTVITYTDDGFSPDSYTVSLGNTVTVKNNSSKSLQFSSDDHPEHQDNSELNLSIINAGESATFTPTKTGTWGFHDHLNDEFMGTLTVTE